VDEDSASGTGVAEPRTTVVSDAFGAAVGVVDDATLGAGVCAKAREPARRTEHPIDREGKRGIPPLC
jgi:hypothetical protein